MKVYIGDHADHQLTLTYGYYDKLTALFTFGGDISMMLFDPTQTTGNLTSQYGKLIATVDGTTILDKVLCISDLDGNWLYNISNNAYNFQVNPCRSSNIFAQEFYTIESSANSHNIISKELFVATISSLILNLASDSGTEDTCTKWTIWGRWLLLALSCLLAVIIAGCVIRKKCGSLKEKFTFLDVDNYPVFAKSEKKISSEDLQELEQKEIEREEKNDNSESSSQFPSPPSPPPFH